MHFSSYHRRRETIQERSKSLRSERDVDLSFLYHSTRRPTRLSQSTFSTYYSLAYLPMPYLPSNTTRSMRSNIQILLYNFLERPTGLKCFLYHFLV